MILRFAHVCVGLFVWSLAATPASAIVGGGVPTADGIGRTVITIVGSRGNFCSGAMIASDIVLTAAHCVPSGASYKIVEYDARRTPQLRDVAAVAIHPQFSPQAMQGHRVTADIAVLRLAAPATGRQAATIGVPRVPVGPSSRFTIAGIGVTIRGDGKSGGIVRAASLTTTGQPGNLQIRLVDPQTGGKQPGMGACTGDSGGPVFEDQQGRAILVGVMSWSTGPNMTAGCGGITGVTPLSLYRDWIVQTARGWGR